MCNSSYKILKKIVHEREMPMADFLKLFPRKFHDHKDFYLAASLFSEGYIDCTTRMSHTGRHENATYSEVQGFDVAMHLHLASLGQGNHTYREINVINPPLEKFEPVFVTAKADLFFEERNRKRWDFILTLTVGILIALISSISTAYFAVIIK